MSAASSTRPEAKNGRKPGLYDSLFSAAEIRGLETQRHVSPEQELLRTIVRRLARLTPLKQLNEKELNALLKLVRLIAMIDALERTEVMRRKGGLSDDPLLASIEAFEVEDL